MYARVVHLFDDYLARLQSRAPRANRTHRRLVTRQTIQHLYEIYYAVFYGHRELLQVLGQVFFSEILFYLERNYLLDIKNRTNI